MDELAIVAGDDGLTLISKKPLCANMPESPGQYWLFSVTGQQTHLSDPTAKGDGVHLFKWTPLLAF
ncbi:TPA: hypothetical protein ACSPGD_005524 [Pseudomonas aeruginosa]